MMSAEPLPDSYADLVRLFNGLFQPSHATILVPGGDEPEYLPADGECRWNRIVFAHGFYASALHEVSHWCIAGHRRRQLYDYGYWYEPDGRDGDSQAMFEQVEARPQALEWLFTVAAGRRFHLSMDNLAGEVPGQRERFAERVHAEVRCCLDEAMPPRAARFLDALQAFYGTRHYFQGYPFTRAQLIGSEEVQ